MLSLRLPDSLADQVREAAAGAGQSANTWIMRSIERALRVK